MTDWPWANVPGLARGPAEPAGGARLGQGGQAVRPDVGLGLLEIGRAGPHVGGVPEARDGDISRVRRVDEGVPVRLAAARKVLGCL